VFLVPRSRASPGSQPEFASFLSVASGRATGGTSRLIKPRERSWSCQLL
jgi:hypothetical protein